jgi:hypothetical protein
MAIPKGHKQNFQTLVDAFNAGDVALMECQLSATGETVAVICAANRMPDGEIQFTPFAIMFNGNPYEMVNPPKAEGGFSSQEEVWK